MEPLKINIDQNTPVDFVNTAMISHTPNEFVIDLVQVLPGSGGKMIHRVIMTPEHAKMLQAALAENVMRFEKNHRTLKVITEFQ